MRRTDQSIRTRRTINPISDREFTIADKYPEKERQITIPEIEKTFIKDQEKITKIGFISPTRRRVSAESRRTEEVSRARDNSSQQGGPSQMGRGFQRAAEFKTKVKAGKIPRTGPIGQAAKPMGLWDRFLAWIKKIFGG